PLSRGMRGTTVQKQLFRFTTQRSGRSIRACWTSRGVAHFCRRALAPPRIAEQLEHSNTPILSGRGQGRSYIDTERQTPRAVPDMSPDRHEWFLNQVFCHRQMLQHYLRRYLNSDEDIEDVIQDTYLRIYGIQDYTAVESPRALLITIAHNLAVELGRRR